MGSFRTTKGLVYLALLLDVISIGIYIPAIEKLIDRYSVTPGLISLGLSVYALFAFFSTPILGQLSDKYGRKRLLVACVFGTALSYLLVIGHHWYRLFIVSRIVNGITGGNFSILQAILSDVSVDDIDRKKNLGLLGAVFGLGFIIGPVLGSFILGRGDVQTLFTFGFLLGLIDTIILFRRLPETNMHFKPHAIIDFSALTTIRTYLKKPGLSSYLRSVMTLGIGVFSYQSVLSIEVRQDFGIGGEYYGYILAAIGLVTALNMAVLLPKVWLRYFSSRTLMIIAHSGLFLTFIGLLINNMSSNNFVVFIILFMCAALFSSLYGPIYQGEMLSHQVVGKTGELTGVIGSLQTLTMVIGPLIGGIILDIHAPLFLTAVLCVLISVGIMFRQRRTHLK